MGPISPSGGSADEDLEQGWTWTHGMKTRKSFRPHKKAPGGLPPGAPSKGTFFLPRRIKSAGAFTAPYQGTLPLFSLGLPREKTMTRISDPLRNRRPKARESEKPPRVNFSLETLPDDPPALH